MRPRTIFATVVVGTVLSLLGSVTFSTLMDFSTEAVADATPPRDLAQIAASLEAFIPQPLVAAVAPAGADGVGLVDPSTGIWHLRTRDGDPASFYFGNPGDFPIMGDWDCNGIDTPGLYRRSDGYVYLRNSNSQGVADIKFFFGNPGDMPLAGDFNGDGCDTVSIYRPSEARIYVINQLGSNDGGLGAAEYSYLFGNPGDKPFTGDFNNDGIDTVGLHRESTGFMYFRNTNTTGVAHYQFYFGDPGDRLVAGNWLGNGEDYPAVYRPSNRTVYMRHSNTQGNADERYQWGEAPYIPVAGRFGNLASGVTVNVSGAPAQLRYAVESFYQDQQSAPHLPAGLRQNLVGLSDRPKVKTVTGKAETSTVYGNGVAVVQANGDTLLAVTDNGWEWRIVGADPKGLGRELWYGDSPRFVALIGADWQQKADGTWPSDPLKTHSDSVHIYSVVPEDGEGALVGFPRDTLMRASFGEVKLSKTMENRGPEFTVGALKTETELPIEGYLHVAMGTDYGRGGVPIGFSDLVDAFGGFPFVVPYDGGAAAKEGDTFVDGNEALAFARERKALPHGDVDRTLGQGLLIKAALATIKPLGILEAPNLLSIMDGFVTTDLPIDSLLTLAATVYTVDPGPMPTFTGTQLDAAGHVSGAAITTSHTVYNQNEGTLPNVMILGCYEPQWLWRLQPQNYATFADLADGTLEAIPWACP